MKKKTKELMSNYQNQLENLEEKIQEVQLSCFEYIEQFYNNYNPHSANKGLTPNQKEENYFKKI